MFKPILLMLSLCAAAAQAEWLTIMGDPANAQVNTVQVDPVPVAVSGEERTLRVRVNRSAPRVNRDGIAYRSFDATVLFDCAVNTARYVDISFYSQPAWSGTVTPVTLAPATMPRWMLFRDIEPNPKDRIIHAACGHVGRL